jgi:YEATS domain-containing protein 4
MSAPSIQAEGDRLDIARIEAVRELERERTRLIDVEKELRKVREKIDALTNSGAGATSAAAGGVRV